MHKVFKFLAGTFGNWYPQTYNSGASIMFSQQPTSSMPNYKLASLLSIGSWIKNGSYITNPSSNPTYTKPATILGVTDVSPEGSTEREVFPTANSSKWTEKAQNIMNKGSAIVPRKPLSGLTTTLDAGYDTTAALVGTVSPVAGTIMQGIGLATDAARALGLGTDLVTTEDQILDSKFLALTPLGLINSFGAKRGLTINHGLDYLRVRADMGAGYGDLSAHLDDAEKYAGKNMGNLFGLRDRANKKVYQGNYDLARLQKIWRKSYFDTAIQGTQSDMAFNKENLRMKGGWLDGAISFGRNGLIIEPLKIRMFRHIAQSIKPLSVFTENEVPEEEIAQFKNGGSFNVIPEGSLHARLHHMEGAEDLTKKGIPVVVEKEGGELELQAEIELNEIIFRLEVTNEIEKLMKDGSDNAAIECGKMLVKEIFENTQDRTGLIESLEEPKLELEEVVKQHRVFQEGGTVKPNFDDWFKTIPEDRNDTTLYNLKRAYELEEWKLLEKWRNATPELLKNDNSYHLRTFYFNPEGIGEFVKHRNHPTIKGELDFYFGDDGKDFREKYYLDTSGDYYKYVPRK